MHSHIHVCGVGTCIIDTRDLPARYKEEQGCAESSKETESLTRERKLFKLALSRNLI